MVERLREADDIVARYTRRHIGIDVVIGVAGLTPIPGAAPAALVASIGLQTPVIYQPMARAIAELYRGTYNKYLSELALASAAAAGTLDVAADFGIAFLKDMALELAREHSLGFGASLIPFIGGFAGAALDVVVARKMTKIVGAMSIIYCENEFAWIGTRNNTRALLLESLKNSGAERASELAERFILRGVRVVRAPRGAINAGSAESWATTIEAARQGIENGVAADNLSPDVINALSRWRGIEPHSLDALDAALHTAAGAFAVDGTLGALKGFLGEEIAQQQIPGARFASAVNQEAWDLVDSHGHRVQVKVGSSAYEQARDALINHPDITIATDPVTAGRLTADGYDVISIDELDNAALSETVDRTVSSIDQFADFAPNVPLVYLLWVTVHELKHVAANRESIGDAVAKITVKAGTREAAMYLVSFVVVGLAAATGILPVAGASIAGASAVAGLSSTILASRLVELGVPDKMAAVLAKIDVRAVRRSILKT
jgi:hypothetical protein